MEDGTWTPDQATEFLVTNGFTAHDAGPVHRPGKLRRPRTSCWASAQRAPPGAGASRAPNWPPWTRQQRRAEGRGHGFRRRPRACRPPRGPRPPRPRRRSSTRPPPRRTRPPRRSRRSKSTTPRRAGSARRTSSPEASRTARSRRTSCLLRPDLQRHGGHQPAGREGGPLPHRLPHGIDLEDAVGVRAVDLTSDVLPRTVADTSNT